MTVGTSSAQPSAASLAGSSRAEAWRLNAAFTLIELLLVVAIIGILASLLFPAFESGRQKSKRLGCESNLRQLALSVQMYCADSEGKLPENRPGGESANNWARGDLTRGQDATNQVLLTQSKLFPYAGHVSLYRCPADASRAYGVPRVRSYSMNSWAGSRYMETANPNAKFRTFLREGELAAAGPANIWLIQDEHEASIDDAWFLVTMDDSRPFANFPGARHGQAYDANFCDGHVELIPLRDPESQQFGLEHEQFSPRNRDWIQLKQVTTVR